MKLLLILMFATTFYYVSADKSRKLLAALLTGMNGGMGNGVIPVRMLGGVNPPVLAVSGAGFVGQPQFAQFVPVAPAPVPNVYNIPAVNTFPFMGVPQIPAMTPPQQTLMGVTGGVMPQQLPLQPDLVRRFRRQIRKQGNTLKTTVDTQIPAPTETMKPTPCKDEGPSEDDFTEDGFQ